MRFSKLEERKQFIALFSGKSGSGKTGAAASFAAAGDLLLIDCDVRSAGIRGCSFITPEMKDKIDVELFGPTKTFKDLDDFLAVQLAHQKVNNFPYKTIIFDSVYTLADMFLRDSQRLRGLEGKFEGKVRGTIHFFHPDDYNYVSMCFHKLIKTVLPQFRCNCIVSSWIVDQYGKDPSNEYGANIIVGQKVLATDKLSEQIPGHFDDILLFEKEEQPNGAVKYFVRTQSKLAKTSYPELITQSKFDITGKSFYQELKKILGEQIA